MLELATARHRAGDLADARRLYHQVLTAEPTHAVALFRGGLLELQDLRPQQALELISKAAAIAPDEPRHSIGMGQALQALGRFTDAAAAFRRALEAEPRSADVHFALGMALHSMEDHLGAIESYQHALAARADYFAALNNLGLCQQRRGRFADAADSYARALALRPREAGAMANLGTVLQEVGRIDQAVELLREAVDLEPKVASHALNLGIALCRRRDFAAAQRVLGELRKREPACADAAFNLGNAMQGLGRPGDAADCYRQAAVLRPGYADALVNLGNVQRELGDNAAAAASYEAALRAQPGCAAALNNAAGLMRSLGRFDAAERMLRSALQANPRHAALHDTLGSVLKDVGELDAAITCFRSALELDPRNPVTHSNLAYALSFQCTDAAPILGECLRWGERFSGRRLPDAPPHDNERVPLRRLRIGYVSPDFREHCQSLFTLPLFAHHEHRNFEIFCYASVDRPDDLTRRIAGMADVWRDVRALDDCALAALIRSDRIDILVDLTMHMAKGRPLLFARKPAPVQVAWLAYPGTTGMHAMDYRISDPRLDPPEFDGHYSERTIRLPDSFWCYDPLTSDPRVNSLPALEHGRVTFGCLNNPCKLTDTTLRLWSGVMRAVADSRLLLLAPPGRYRLQLLQRFERLGVAGDRIHFVAYRSRALYLQTYRDIDVGLDTTPYNGHTTSLDALWMGVPTVTRIGNTCVGRGGLSQLFQLGLSELAAGTDEAYLEASVSLLRDLPRLAALRQELRPRLEQSPLMDATRFARNMEAAYRGIWSTYCASADARSDCIIP